jgi:hypothetical protein
VPDWVPLVMEDRAAAVYIAAMNASCCHDSPDEDPQRGNPAYRRAPAIGGANWRTVDALAPKDSGEVALWDQEMRGFGIRARVGGAKTYILHYRAGTGRGAPLRKLTIGKRGSPWTPDMARPEAKRLLGLIASGEDPAEHPTSGRGLRDR